MAASDVRQAVLSIINAVLRKLFLNTVSATTDTKMANLMVQKLNEIIDDIGDFGDWQSLYAETSVAIPASGTSEYELGLTSPIQRILEISVSGQVSSLLYQEPRELLQMIRVGTVGVPRHFTLLGTDSQENPKFRVSPIPTSAQTTTHFKISYYSKHRMYTAGTDDAEIPDFNAVLLIQGLYAAMLLHENGGEQTNEYQTELARYERLKQQALNRYISDTGTDMFIQPNMQFGGPR